MKHRNYLGWVTLAGFLFYMLAPILATYAFSFAVRWDRTLLPEGLTLDWYHTTFTDPWFSIVFRHSMIISITTVAASVLIIVPTTYWVYLRVPKARPLINLITTLPFAVPAVVMALGLIRLYAQPPFIFGRTPAMLVIANVIFTMPFMYRPVSNSLEAIDFRILTEAAQSLGASWTSILTSVILPNILPGIISGALLVFATIFGEFTLATLLVGARYKTFPMQLVYYTRRDGRIASAYTVISFTIAWLASVLILRILSWGVKRTGRRAFDVGLGQK